MSRVRRRKFPTGGKRGTGREKGSKSRGMRERVRRTSLSFKDTVSGEHVTFTLMCYQCWRYSLHPLPYLIIDTLSVYVFLKLGC